MVILILLDQHCISVGLTASEKLFWNDKNGSIKISIHIMNSLSG